MVDPLGILDNGQREISAYVDLATAFIEHYVFHPADDQIKWISDSFPAAGHATAQVPDEDILQINELIGPMAV
jgi:hypothetical protein